MHSEHKEICLGDEPIQLEIRPYSLFVGSIRSPVTKEKYLQRMGYFFDYLNIEEKDVEESFEILTQKAKGNMNWFANAIFVYLQGHKGRVERKEISSATLRNYVKPIKLYCEQMDIQIPWKKIMRGMPKGKRYGNDRAPTIEEISKLIAYPDRRIRPIIYTMTSSGIRLGAWNYLRWGHIIPVFRNDQVITAKIIVYANEEDEYFSFITREAFESLSEWMSYRKQCGEEVTGDSWLMRNLWDVTTPKGKGIVTLPKRLRITGVKRLVERALWAQGVRVKLDKKRKRHDFQADHGFRKWFKTRCESAGMKSINIETLMGHSIGLSDSYYRPTENELLNDYLNATYMLTLDDTHKLQEQVTELKDKSLGQEHIIKTKLDEKDRVIDTIRKKYDSEIILLKNTIADIQNLLKHPEKLVEIME